MLARVVIHVLARVVIHVLAHVLLQVLAPLSTILARVVLHVLARVLLHVLARVIIHVHDYYSKTCDPDPQTEVENTNDYYADSLYEEGSAVTRDNNSMYES